MPSDDSFASFVEEHGSRLLRYAILIGGDGEAEDLVQEALSRLLARWASLTLEDPLPYALKSISNLKISWWRKKQHDNSPVADSVTFDDFSDRVALRVSLLRALHGLPHGQRKVVALRYYLGLSEHEAAKILDWKIGTVKSQSARGLANLRSSLFGSDGALRPAEEGTWRAP